MPRLAVAGPAQPVLLAALAALHRALAHRRGDRDRGGRRPAGRRPGLLPAPPWRRRRPGATVGPIEGPVVVLPAWETLPFERVSPEVETMGRRLALSWGLTHGDDAAAVRPGAPDHRGADPRPPAAARALPATVRRRIVVRPGQELAADELLGQLVAAGLPPRAPGRAPRESSPCGAASSTCSPPPPTCRCASTSGATRWTG